MMIGSAVVFVVHYVLLLSGGANRRKQFTGTKEMPLNLGVFATLENRQSGAI
jgi:hypothetical protein